MADAAININANDANPEAELTDGFHLIIDALKLNGVETIYHVPGIPVTDLGRMMQAEGMRVISFRHESNAGNAAAIAGYLTRKPGVCLTVSCARLPQRSGGLEPCNDQLLADDPHLRFIRTRDCGSAERRLRGDGPVGHRQAAVQGGLSYTECRGHRRWGGPCNPCGLVGPPGRRLPGCAGKPDGPDNGRHCTARSHSLSRRSGACAVSFAGGD